MEHGHPNARFYPLGTLVDEVNIVVERVNALEVTRATLLQLAVSSILYKKSGELFDKRIAALSFETLAHEDDNGG